MSAAYRQADWKPDDVDLIECHATGTPVGDAVEVASLRELWQNIPPRQERCVIGSVKSNIGHLLTAAGAAALTKVLLAMQHHDPAPHRQLQPSAARHGTGQQPLYGADLRHFLATPWRRHSTPGSGQRFRLRRHQRPPAGGRMDFPTSFLPPLGGECFFSLPQRGRVKEGE